MNDRLQQFFQAHAGEWLDGRQLGAVAGAYAWRSRVAECRTQRGMVIENRQRKVRGAIGMVTVSEYRHVRDLLSQPILSVSGCTCASMADPPCGWCDGPDRDFTVDSAEGQA